MRSSAPTPPILTDSGRTAIRVVLVLSAALLLLGGLGTLGAAAVGIGSTRVLADSRALPSAMRSVSIDTGDLPMAVRVTADAAAREPRAELRFISAAKVGPHTLDISGEATSTRIAVKGEAPEWLDWARAGELTLVLPPNLARGLSVTTRQRTGVLMADADIDELVADTTNGAVLLRGAARRIDVHTRNGAVHTRNPITVAESVRVETAEGPIGIELTGAPPRTIEAITRRGDIAIALAGRGPFLVDARAGRYHEAMVNVTQTSDARRAAATITAHSTTGSVTVDELD